MKISVDNLSTVQLTGLLVDVWTRSCQGYQLLSGYAFLLAPSPWWCCRRAEVCGRADRGGGMAGRMLVLGK